MKRAVIDIGTNSVILLIADDTDGELSDIFQRFTVTRLGENVRNSGQLTPQAMTRTMDVLSSYFRDIDQAKPVTVDLLGTESLRMANNKNEFIDKVKNKYGYDIKIVSGDEEARYCYMGAKTILPGPEKKIVVIDVGGGSSEIIAGSGAEITFSRSVPTGVVKIGEQYLMKSQLSAGDVTRVCDTVQSQFSNLSVPDDHLLVGTGGTITSLVAVKEKIHPYDPEQINGSPLRLMELEDMFAYLNAMTLEQRRNLPGLVAGREDVILFGTLIYITVMRMYKMKLILASDRGLRFGYLLDLANLKAEV